MWIKTFVEIIKTRLPNCLSSSYMSGKIILIVARRPFRVTNTHHASCLSKPRTIGSRIVYNLWFKTHIKEFYSCIFSSSPQASDTIYTLVDIARFIFSRLAIKRNCAMLSFLVHNFSTNRIARYIPPVNCQFMTSLINNWWRHLLNWSAVAKCHI